MADEVIIIEMKSPALQHNGTTMPVLGEVITTQVLDIGTASAALKAATKAVRIQSRGTGFWWIGGGASPSATADTDGNAWLPADQSVDINVTGWPGLQKFDTAAAT